MGTISIEGGAARLLSKSLALTADATFGGRIIEFSLAGSNALCSTGVQIGSTFWPSPQSLWGWPPPPVLDSAPYRLDQICASAFTLTSDLCPLTQLWLTKRVGEALPGRAVRVEYTLENASAETRAVAPWEITRVPGGLSFYESECPPLPLSEGNMAVVQAAGCSWYQYAPEKLVQPSKIFAANTGGWLANVHQGLLLLKGFVPIAPEEAAPGEAEVEIYAHNALASPYIELEQQGAYTQLEPGGKLTWTVYWLLAAVPSAISPDIGSPQLLDFLRQQLEDITVARSLSIDPVPA